MLLASEIHGLNCALTSASKTLTEKAALGQFYTRPFVVHADDQAVAGTDGQTRFKVTASTAEIVPPPVLSAESHRPLVAHVPVDLIAVVPVLIPSRQDNRPVRAHAEISLELFEFPTDAEADVVSGMSVQLEYAEAESLRQHDISTVARLVEAETPLELADQGVVSRAGREANEIVELLDTAPVDETHGRIKVGLRFGEAHSSRQEIVEVIQRRPVSGIVPSIVRIRRCDVMPREGEVLVAHEAARAQN